MKCAIIGLGVIGKVHAKVLNKMGENIVAVCDIDQSKFALFPDAKGYTDYREMLETEEIDVVHICTPHYLHAQMVVEALGKDINVLCEKPLCISLSQIDEILLAEKNSKAQLGVCHQNRYNQENLFLKDFIKDKKVTGGYGAVAWHRAADYYNKADWRGTWEFEGGGVLINQALHTLDLMQWMCGMPTEITATCANLCLKDTIEVEDTASLVCSGGGVDFSFYASNSAPAYFPVSVSLHTEEGVVTAIPDKVIMPEKTIDFKRCDEAYGKGCYGSGHGGLTRDFYDCVKTGRKFDIDGEEGSKVVRIILAAYKSKGEKIKI